MTKVSGAAKWYNGGVVEAMSRLTAGTFPESGWLRGAHSPGKYPGVHTSTLSLGVALSLVVTLSLDASLVVFSGFRPMRFARHFLPHATALASLPRSMALAHSPSPFVGFVARISHHHDRINLLVGDV